VRQALPRVVPNIGFGLFWNFRPVTRVILVDMMRFLVCLLIPVALAAQPRQTSQPLASDCAIDGSVVNAATGRT